jgi:RNA polymerase sigma-70 factor (ECF subfamily)
MFAIARNELYGWYRHHRATAALDPESMTADELVPSPSQAVRARSERRLLLESLRRIPLDSQVLLELHYWSGLSSAELAGVLDAAPSTIRSRLARARDQLEGQLTQLAGAAPLHTTADDIDAWAVRIGRYVQEDAEPE